MTIDAPTRSDGVARAASAIIGGPQGSRAGLTGRRWGPGGGVSWAILVLSLLAGLVLGTGLVLKDHCRAHGWSSPDQFWHACYSDSAVLFDSKALGGPDAPSLVEAVSSSESGLGQPPLTGAVMWLVSKVVSGTDVAAERTYFDLSAVLMAMFLAVAVAAVALAAGRRPWDAAHVALAPVVLTVGLVSYDLMAVALLALALLAWSRRADVAGGVLLGAAISSRPITAMVLLAVLTLGVRAGRTGAAARFCAGAAVTWLGLRFVLVQGATGGLGEAFDSWRSSVPGYGSPWMVPLLVSQSRPDQSRLWPLLQHVWYTGDGLSGTASTLCAVVGLVVVGLATVFLGLSVTDRPRLAHLALFAVAGTMIVTKSFPVQASLLLLPLVALAGLRWRDHLVWAATEVAYFAAVWLYIAGGSNPQRALPAGYFLLFLLLRIGGVAWLMTCAVRALRNPWLDPVRVPPDGVPGADDPLGGPVEGAPDALVVRLV